MIVPPHTAGAGPRTTDTPVSGEPRRTGTGPPRGRAARRRVALASISALGLLAACVAGTAPPTPEEIRAAALGVDDGRLLEAENDSANWLTHGRTYSEARFSPLGQIHAGNVADLGLAWTLELDARRGLEATPLVLDGVMFTTGSWSVVYALDAATGEVLWSWDPEVPRSRAKFYCCDVVNRGVALYRGMVYAGTLDGRLAALDASDGTPVWVVPTGEEGWPYGITGAPRVVRGKVLIGNSGADYGVRGYVSAYDAGSGELVWRTYTVPGDPARGFESTDMERAAATWTGEWWRTGGGGTVWDAIVYDPDLDLVYIGTGNGSPWDRTARSPGGGDNLYLASILALRPSDGAMVWYYQTTPAESWDYTATQPMILADLALEAGSRSVLMQAPKNGFFYVLDRRALGSVISADPYVGVTWALGVDPVSGRAMEAPGAYRVDGIATVRPTSNGGHNWHPMAFSPQTGLVYIPALEAESSRARDPDWRHDPTWRNTATLNLARQGTGAGSPSPVEGFLLAWDPVVRREAWRHRHDVPLSGGTLATAGGLVFQGTADGRLLALGAADGKVLWEGATGSGVVAPPVTYMVDGVQYIALSTGLAGSAPLWNGAPLAGALQGPGRVVAFRLGGNARLPTINRRRPGPPRPPDPGALGIPMSSESIDAGRALYGDHCGHCHGGGANSLGSVADLRYSSGQTHAVYDDIVLRGAWLDRGMPEFADQLNSSELRQIQAFVIDRARAAARQNTVRSPDNR